MLQLSYVLVYCALLAPYYAYSQSESEVFKPGPCPKLPHPLPKATLKDKIFMVGIFTNGKSLRGSPNLTPCKLIDFRNPEGYTLIGTDNKSYFLFYVCTENNVDGKKFNFEIATAFVVPKGPDPGTDKRIREALDKNKLGLKEWFPFCKV
ncbi:uncharacterized protein LOC115632978 [Scaptodrosophila lebanonensis]|uniref:Uncharacterized protein LOC115632978 n=1 Tax=Drosophila lebanonensis TaxID=7225 RepID=A0A6J2UCP5_DROLE|nr:uncharacterized protein LOC115632978 [Scaptodrosophila lebanonensis]